jgi:hypothetical protein
MSVNSIHQLGCNFGKYLISKSFFNYSFLLLILLIIKNGIAFLPENIESSYLPASRALPQPISYVSESLGNLLLMRAIGVNTLLGWEIAHLLILMIVYVIIVLNVFVTHDKNQSFLLSLFVVFPLINSSLTLIGNYDAFTILGGALIGYSKKRYIFFIGCLFLALGNPSQSVIALLIVLIISLLNLTHVTSRTAGVGLMLTLVFYGVVYFWMQSSDGIVTRRSLYWVYLRPSIENFLRDPSSFIWFLFGSTWIIIFLIMSSLKRAHYVIVTLILIFVALISLTTFDGPRVFTLIFLPAFLLLVRAQIVEKYKEEDLISLLGVLALSYLVAPSSLNSWRLLIGYF